MISPNGTHGAVIVLTNIKIFSIPRIRKGKYFASFTDLPHKSTQQPRTAPAFSPFFSFPLLLYAASHASAPSSPEPPSPGDIHRPPVLHRIPAGRHHTPAVLRRPAGQPGSLSIHPIQPRRATSGHPLPQPGCARVHRSATRSGSIHPPRAQKKGRPVIGRSYNSGG